MVAVTVEGVVVGARDLTPGEAARRARVVGRLLRPGAVEEDDRAQADRRRGVAEAFGPAGAWRGWLCDRVAALMARVERAERVEAALRDRAAYRAFDFWEEDQQLAAEVLGARLKRDPARTALKLRQTPAGLDWLAGRWRALARLDPEGWDDAHLELAARLLGGDESVDPTAPGFAAAQVEAIEALRPRVEEDDALRRRLVEADLSDADVPDLARLRRQVRQWQREIEWCVARLRDVAPAPTSAVEPRRDETNPASADRERANDETKPMFAGQFLDFDETKSTRPAGAALPHDRGVAREGAAAPSRAGRP